MTFIDEYDRYYQAAEAAQKLLEEIRNIPAADVTPEQHRKADQLAADVVAARKVYDQSRTVSTLEAVAAPLAWFGRGIDPITGLGPDGGPHCPPEELLAAAVTGAPTGPAAEFLQHHAVAAGAADNPSAWAGKTGIRFPWLSQVKLSTTDAFGHETLTRPTISPVFPTRDDLDALGISPTQVRVGDQQAVWLRPPTAVTLAEGAAVTIDDVAGDPKVLKPHRVASGSRITFELAAVSPMAAQEILTGLMDAVMDEMADQVIGGDKDTSGQFDGLLKSVTAPDAATARTTYQGYVSAFTGPVDGVYAMNVGDLYAVVGADVHADMAASFVSAGSGEQSAAGHLADALGALVVSPRLAAADKTTGVTSNVLLRRGRRRGATFWPVWGTVEINSMVDPRASTFGSGRILIGMGFHSFAVAPATAARDDFVRLSVDIKA